MADNFIEKRKYYRLPFGESSLLTDGKNTVVGGALNLSRGGIFLKTLNPLPINSYGYLSFVIPGQQNSVSLKVKVAHLIFDRQRAEVDCGMGLQFVEVSLRHQQFIDSYLQQIKNAYLELQRILKPRRPSVSEIEKQLALVKDLRGLDLSSLRYRVNRICTIFESAPELAQLPTG